MRFTETEKVALGVMIVVGALIGCYMWYLANQYTSSIEIQTDKIETKDEMIESATIKVELEAKQVFEIDDINVLGVVESRDTYLKFELLVGTEVKQAYYFKDTSEIKIIE